MDEKLISTVFNYPELYNVTLPNYRCTESRTSAWRNISLALGLPPEDCKRKWKNLRDRYLKEVRLESKGKRQGDDVHSKWKYRQSMSFIAPFTGSRGVLELCCEQEHDNQSNESESTEGESAMPEPEKTPRNKLKFSRSPSEVKSQGGTPCQGSEVSPLASAAKLPAGSQTTPQSHSGRKRKLEMESLKPKKRPGKENGTSHPSRPRDEDELFLLSFVPALKRLAPQKRCETKMRIQQMMYEAEFQVTQAELRERKLGMATSEC